MEKYFTFIKMTIFIYKNTLFKFVCPSLVNVYVYIHVCPTISKYFNGKVYKNMSKSLLGIKENKAIHFY